jgi:hypothetical protein
MKKKIEGKLTLNRETLRALDPKALSGAVGGVTEWTEGTVCTGGTNSRATCDSCYGPDC